MLRVEGVGSDGFSKVVTSNTHFFIRTYFLRTQRLNFGQNIIAISKHIRVEIYLTVSNESLHLASWNAI